MARRKTRKRRTRRAAPRRRRRVTYTARRRPRRRRRRNMPMLANPPRRRRRSSGGGRATLKSLVPSMKELGGGVAGAAGVRMLPGLIAARFPMVPTEGPAGLAVKGALSVLIGKGVSMVAGKRMGEMAALGGLIIVAEQALQEYVLPQLGINAYLADDYGVAAYLDTGGGMGSPMVPGVGLPALAAGDSLDELGQMETTDRLSSAGRGL